jgi:nicotinamidase-related amidase
MNERMVSMSNETRSTPLDLITPENAVLLIVDQQEGWFSRISEPEQTQRRLLALARAAKLLGVPTVLTTNMAAGLNGPQVQALSEVFAGQEVIDRTVIDAWQDPRVHEAVVATSRQKVIIAGTGFELCATLPALSSLAEGYDAYVVYDASGRITPLPITGITRLSQAGAVVLETGPLVLEMMADNTHAKAGEIYAILA